MAIESGLGCGAAVTWVAYTGVGGGDWRAGVCLSSLLRVLLCIRVCMQLSGMRGV